MREFMFATGIECSYPTIENGRWRMDQLETSGHYRRWKDDLQLVKELGITYLRYGPPLHKLFLGPGRYDWSFADDVVAEMGRLGIIPIMDLCHFGVPDWIENFQNEDFSEYFAEYASAFAKRYPSVYLFTPVNEMYVTAKMSALDGAWNEQLRGEPPFARAVINLARANAKAIIAIRKENSSAYFITSESSEFFTPCCPDDRIQHIADFENQRRFIALDLVYSVPLREDLQKHMYQHGLSPSEYEWFQNLRLENLILGIDYYAWNEKLVDAQGNVEQLGVLFGWYVIASQYYARYKRPLMHTETNCPNATDAPAWLWQQWHNVQLIRAEGVPVVGFTWYSLLDQIDWNTGLARANGEVYPVGLYDLNRDIRLSGIAYKQLLEMYKGDAATMRIESPTERAKVGTK